MKTLAPLFGLIAGLSAAPAFAGDLTLNFDVGQPTGTVKVALFDSEAAYDGQGAPARVAEANIGAGQTTATFDDLPDGDYAARLFHDVNDNGKMDANPFGMPVEPYAFTNNARGMMGPARWDQARVAVSGHVAQTIVLK